jgi:hypothetical protein
MRPARCERTTVTRNVALTWTAVAALLFASTGCSDHYELAFTRQLEARRIGQELLVQFTTASDATNRAVMADTDEASVAFAQEARDEARSVEASTAALADLIRGLGYKEESDLIREFEGRYAKYSELDRQILELAVENTNIKAQRLSFGSAHAAADTFKAALEELSQTPPARQDCAIRTRALAATVALRELEGLQVRHIAESKDEVMSAFEVQMKQLEADARAALADLAGLHRAELQPGLDAANAALAQYLTLQTQILSLSRRNSNVRSLELALGPKPPLKAACEQTLRALNQKLAQHQLKATR